MRIQQVLQQVVPIFMKNATLFIILAVLSVVLLLYTLWRKRDIKLVALFLGISSVAGLLENVIYLWFPSYEYYPKMLKNPFYDMTLGAYLSQLFYVSTVAMFIAAFNLRYGWILFFTAMFVGIEFLFIALGIYKLIWWNPGYTLIGLLIYFWMTKKWYSLLLQASSPFLRLFTLFGISHIIYAHLIIIPLFSNHYHFAVNWFDSPERSSLTVINIYFIIRGVLTALVCFYRLHWSLQASVPILILVSYFVLIHQHIFTFNYLWDLYLLFVADIVALLCCNYFNRILSKTSYLPK